LSRTTRCNPRRPAKRPPAAVNVFARLLPPPNWLCIVRRAHVRGSRSCLGQFRSRPFPQRTRSFDPRLLRLPSRDLTTPSVGSRSFTERGENPGDLPCRRRQPRGSRESSRPRSRQSGPAQRPHLDPEIIVSPRRARNRPTSWPRPRRVRETTPRVCPFTTRPWNDGPEDLNRPSPQLSQSASPIALRDPTRSIRSRSSGSMRALGRVSTWLGRHHLLREGPRPSPRWSARRDPSTPRQGVFRASANVPLIQRFGPRGRANVDGR